jgi:hypothetical protein
MTTTYRGHKLRYVPGRTMKDAYWECTRKGCGESHKARHSFEWCEKEKK